MDRGKKSSGGLSPQSPSRSRPANISAEQSRGQAGSRQGTGWRVFLLLTQLSESFV